MFARSEHKYAEHVHHAIHVLQKTQISVSVPSFVFNLNSFSEITLQRNFLQLIQLNLVLRPPCFFADGEPLSIMRQDCKMNQSHQSPLVSYSRRLNERINRNKLESFSQSLRQLFLNFASLQVAEFCHSKDLQRPQS